MTPQHLDALAKGNDLRLRSADTRSILRDMTSTEGRYVVARWLDDQRPEIEATRLLVVLQSIRRVGERQAKSWLDEAGISEIARDREVRVRDLTHRQRYALVCVLRGEPVPAIATPTRGAA